MQKSIPTGVFSQSKHSLVPRWTEKPHTAGSQGACKAQLRRSGWTTESEAIGDEPGIIISNRLPADAATCRPLRQASLICYCCSHKQGGLRSSPWVGLKLHQRVCLWEILSTWNHPPTGRGSAPGQTFCSEPPVHPSSSPP